jgi:hypothetical protein
VSVCWGQQEEEEKVVGYLIRFLSPPRKKVTQKTIPLFHLRFPIRWHLNPIKKERNNLKNFS